MEALPEAAPGGSSQLEGESLARQWLAAEQEEDLEAWARLDLREAGRYKANEARAQQEAAWAGTNVDARQIWGVREAQRIYGQQLRKAMGDLYKVRVLAAGLLQRHCCWGRLLPPLAAKILHFEGGRGSSMNFVSAWNRQEARESLLTVCVRMRPLLKWEKNCGEWEAVEVLPRDASVLCHDGRLSRSGRQLMMSHKRFVLDRVWGPSSDTAAVYADVIRPLLQDVQNGFGATLLCMGQTGTGKTYTICGVADCLSKDLVGTTIEVEFFEIYGKKCLDLLANRKEVQLRSDAEDRVHVAGQRVVRLESAAGLSEILEQALRLRASEETQRNEASSRSHAVCTIRLYPSSASSLSGVLRLVDLAGSERNFETTKMTAQQHRESAEINASLMVLKDCFRAHAAAERGERVLMPFRGSRLTRVLKDCFTSPHHRTVVIGTISPAASDVIHTVNTLVHATMLAKCLSDLTSQVTLDIPLHLEGMGSYKDVPVAQWTPADVHAWLREAENGRFAHVVVPPLLDGRQLLGTSAQGLSDLFEGELRRARGDNEGEAWTVQVDDVGRDIGRELFAAARRAALAQGHAPGH